MRAEEQQPLFWAAHLLVDRETLLRGPKSGSSKWTPQRSWWSEDAPVQIPLSSLAARCLSSPPLLQQYRHTSTRSSRQILQGKHNHKHFPSYGLIFSPRHKASSDFWIFPSLFTSQWLSRIWRNLSRSTPLMLGCRQRKNSAERENGSGFPQLVKQPTLQQLGNPPKEEWPKGPTSAHMWWGSKQKTGNGCPAKAEGAWHCELSV